jgi:hypothetical protein
MVRSIVLAIAVGLGLGVTVAAQEAARVFSWSAAEQAPVGGIAAGPGGPGLSVIALDPLSVGETIVGAPYSAEAVTEMTQTLADGNRIEQRTTAAIARDSQGRTRREQQAIAFGSFVASNDQPIVTITDPATGTHTTLNYDLKVAFRSKAPSLDLFKARIAERRANAPGEAMASQSTTTATATAGAVGRVTRFETPVVDQVMIDDRPFEIAVPPPPPPPPPMMASRVPFDASVVTETLPSQSFDGIRGEGTRTTMTIPAGAMGNALPIEVVTERWHSPELQVILMTRRVDPRFGETVYRLTNIDRSEPSADLFKVPAGFKIDDVQRGVPRPVRPE